MKRALFVVLAAVAAAVLSSAANAGVCLVVLGDLRSCVATAPDEPATAPVSDGAGGGVAVPDGPAAAPVSGESGGGATS